LSKGHRQVPARDFRSPVEITTASVPWNPGGPGRATPAVCLRGAAPAPYVNRHFPSCARPLPSRHQVRRRPSPGLQTTAPTRVPAQGLETCPVPSAGEGRRFCQFPLPSTARKGGNREPSPAPLSASRYPEARWNPLRGTSRKILERKPAQNQSSRGECWAVPSRNAAASPAWAQIPVMKARAQGTFSMVPTSPGMDHGPFRASLLCPEARKAPPRPMTQRKIFISRIL